MTNYEELCKLDTERTQGDWQVDSEYTRDPEVIIHCGNYAIAPIIRHGMMGHTGREMSDAQFIAAAPEMFALLKKYREALERIASKKAGDVHAITDMWQTADNALKQIKGEK